MRNELRLVREQAKSDFEFIMRGLARQRDVFKDEIRQVDASVTRVEGSVRQVEASVRQVEASVRRVEDSVRKVEASVVEIQGSLQDVRGSLVKMEGALEEQQRIFGAYAERTDQRFATLIDMFDGHSDRMQTLEERVRKLEARQPPAA